MKRLYVRTFGCQMNVYDSGKLKALLASDGFEQTEQMGDADLVIVNTCSIRDKPEQKLHSFLGEALATKRKADRKVTVAVAGCVAQASTPPAGRIPKIFTNAAGWPNSKLFYQMPPAGRIQKFFTECRRPAEL